MVCLSNRWDFSSLNTFLCLMYSLGRFVSVLVAIRGFVLHRRICSCQRVLVLFCDWDRKRALAASGALKTMGSWVWSIHPLFQSIFGWVAANQGYPSIALCSPSSVRKNLMLVVVDPVWVAKSV